MKTLPILIVEDDRDLREALGDTLAMAGYETLMAEHGEAALACLHERKVGLVVSDVQMKPMDGHALLQAVKHDFPDVPVLLMTAYGMIDKAVDAMRKGACNYLTKPFEPDVLLAEVARFMRPSGFDGEGDVIALDPKTEAVLALARRVADTNATVLISGESGTGKEVVARYIHRHSSRSAAPFVAVNCAAIPENLLESTMFGFEKGAFTGAAQAQSGKFEQAQGGTLLLDEITEMPLALQAKLLRVLQEREVERVGGKKSISLDVRVIATSNRDLEEAVKTGVLREDLFYRLSVFPLHIPALRERPADIVPLAQYFLRRMADGMRRHGMVLSDEAEARLTLYDWPGNIRELENVIQRAMILAPGSVIEVDHLLLPKRAENFAAPSEPAHREAPPRQDMKSLERSHILETLATVNGSRKLAAQRLGMSERTLRYKLQQYRGDGESAEGPE